MISLHPFSQNIKKLQTILAYHQCQIRSINLITNLKHPIKIVLLPSNSIQISLILVHFNSIRKPIYKYRLSIIALYNLRCLQQSQQSRFLRLLNILYKFKSPLKFPDQFLLFQVPHFYSSISRS